MALLLLSDSRSLDIGSTVGETHPPIQCGGSTGASPAGRYPDRVGGSLDRVPESNLFMGKGDKAREAYLVWPALPCGGAAAFSGIVVLHFPRPSSSSYPRFASADLASSRPASRHSESTHRGMKQG
jgi:hypothetical protein